jgi:hypothetical protein
VIPRAGHTGTKVGHPLCPLLNAEWGMFSALEATNLCPQICSSYEAFYNRKVKALNYGCLFSKSFRASLSAVSTHDFGWPPMRKND